MALSTSPAERPPSAPRPEKQSAAASISPAARSKSARPGAGSAWPARVWQQYLFPAGRRVMGLLPFTKTGVAFLAFFAASAWFQGLLHLDLVLLIASLAGLLILAILLSLTAVGALLLFLAARRTTTAGELDLETTVAQPTGLRLRVPRWLPFVTYHSKWVEFGDSHASAEVELRPMGGAAGWAEYAAPRRRCVVQQIVRKLAVRDLFGLTELSWYRKEKVRLRVLPHRGLLTQMPPPAGLADGDDLSDPYAEPRGDRLEMRQYAPGDPLRMVLWKVYARTGKMMVRTPERSVAERRKGCAFLMTAKNDDATAAVARIALERGLLGEDWCFGAEGVARSATDLESALEVLAESGESAPPTDGEQLARFLDRCAAEGYQFCILFVPPEERAWKRSAPAAGSTMRVQTLTGVDDLVAEEPKRRPILDRVQGWLIEMVPPSAVPFARLRELAASVPGLGWTNGVAERRSGQLINDILGGRG